MKTGVKDKKTGVKNIKTEVKDQKIGVKDRKTGVKDKKTGVKDRNTGLKTRFMDIEQKHGLIIWKGKLDERYLNRSQRIWGKSLEKNCRKFLKFIKLTPY